VYYKFVWSSNSGALHQGTLWTLSTLPILLLYAAASTGWVKKISCYTLVNNLGKYGPISIILSLLQSVMNCGKYGNKSCHVTSNMLPHYVVKFNTKSQLFILCGMSMKTESSQCRNK